MRPVPDLKKPNTTLGSMAAFTTDWIQSLVTFNTVPRKQVGSPATLAALKWGPASHAWLMKTWTVWLTPSSGSIPDEDGESQPERVDDGVVTTGVGTGEVATVAGVTLEVTLIFFLSRFSGFSGLAVLTGFSNLAALSSLAAFSGLTDFSGTAFVLPLKGNKYTSNQTTSCTKKIFLTNGELNDPSSCHKATLHYKSALSTLLPL